MLSLSPTVPPPRSALQNCLAKKALTGNSSDVTLSLLFKKNK